MVHLRDSASPYGVFVQIRGRCPLWVHGVPQPPSKEKRWGWVSTPNEPLVQASWSRAWHMIGQVAASLLDLPREVFLMFKVNALNSHLTSFPICLARSPSTPASVSRAPQAFSFSFIIHYRSSQVHLSTSLDLSVSSSSYLSASGLSPFQGALPHPEPRV